MGSVALARQDGKRIRVNDKARRTHMHVLGISGQGKSYFLEHLIRQDIIAGNGVCVIDPHGELYDNLVRWIASEGIETIRTIHLLDPASKTYSFGFNPLVVDNGTALEYRVDAMVDACVKVWGGQDITQTPRLAKCLSAVFHALAENRLSLAEARFLTNTQLKREARKLTRTIRNEEFRALWQEFIDGYSDKAFTEFFESTTSRLIRFVGNPIVREIVGQTENVIDFKRCMDEGHIVLVNLAPRGAISKSVSQLIGALIANDLYTTAFSRDVETAKAQPFYCYIDECAQYLTEDVVNALDETRKFGLQMVLSHQRIEQLRAYGDNFYNAVMANAQLKVVFKVGDDDTADILSRHLFRTTFDLEMPKHILDKPVTIGQELHWFESESRSVSSISGSGEGSGAGTGIGMALSQLHDSEGNPIGGYGMVDSASESNFLSSNRFHVTGETYSRGRSQGLVPIIEVLPTELYKIDELIHLGMVELRALPERTAWVCSPGEKPFKVTTLDIKPGALVADFIPDVVETINQRSAYVSTRKDVRDRIAMRAFAIEETAAGNRIVGEDEDDEDDGLGY